MNSAYKKFTMRAVAVGTAIMCVLCSTACKSIVSDSQAIRTEIITYPPGARIEINGDYIGHAPLKFAFHQDATGSVIGTYQILATPIDPTLLPESDWLGANVRVPPKLMVRLKPAAEFVTSSNVHASSNVAAKPYPSDADIGLIPLPPNSLRPVVPSKGVSDARIRWVPGAYVVGSGHWIDGVMDDGKLIKLEDGSLWKVSPLDAIDSALWLPVTDITIIDSDDPAYPFKLVNKDDNEVVNARLLER